MLNRFFSLTPVIGVRLFLWLCLAAAQPLCGIGVLVVEDMFEEVSGLPATDTQQQYEQILARHVEALGGAERLAGVSSVRKWGVMRMEDAATPLIIEKLRPASLRIIIETAQGPMTEIYHNGEAWSQQPGQGFVKVDASRAQDLAVEAHLFDLLVGMEARGYRIIFSDETDNGQHIVLHLESSNGRRSIYYLNRETWLVDRILQQATFDGLSRVLESRILEYTEVDGIQFPSLMRTEIQGVLSYEVRIEGIDINPDDIGKFWSGIAAP